MSLDHLAKRIARQEKDAFAELYNKTSGIVYSVCLAIVKDKGLAEELTQDSFVCVWSEINSFRGVGLKTWLLTIARNKALNELRKRKREVAVDFSENERLGGSYDVETSIETSVLLDLALAKLDVTDRQIVLMKNSGAKMKEIALLLEMPRGTVSWRYAEALKILKNYLEVRE